MGGGLWGAEAAYSSRRMTVAEQIVDRVIEGRMHPRVHGSEGVHSSKGHRGVHEPREAHTHSSERHTHGSKGQPSRPLPVHSGDVHVHSREGHVQNMEGQSRASLPSPAHSSQGYNGQGHSQGHNNRGNPVPVHSFEVTRNSVGQVGAALYGAPSVRSSAQLEHGSTSRGGPRNAAHKRMQVAIPTAEPDFDHIDTNRDGVLDRKEWNGAFGGSSSQEENTTVSKHQHQHVSEFGFLNIYKHRR